VSTTDTNDRAQACERGSAIDCTLSAGGSQERLERACHLGDAAGCERAGLALLSPNVGTARADDVSSAIAMLERACDARDALACSRAGAVLDAGKTIPRDAARATRLLTRACREGDATSCVRAGTMLAKGDGIERDDVRANELLERACNLGDGYRKACFDLARRVASGQGGVPDLRRAADLYLRGCAPPESTDESEEGNHSCSRAGSMYETGDGVKKDFERGMTLHLLACRRTGDKRSCFAAGNWLEKRSRGRGVALYQEVCRKFQLKEACQRSHLSMARSTIGRSTVVESFGAFGVEQPRAPGLGVFAEIATRHRLEALMSDRRGQVRFAPFGHVARQIIDEVLEEGGSSHAPGSKAGSLNISERCVGFVATWCQARDEVRRRTILRRENASAVEIRASDVTIRHRSSHDIFTPRVAHVARCLAGDGMFDPHASDERHLDVDPCPGLVGRRGYGDGHEEATRAVGE
jgi:TPR repeat protein